MRILHFFSLSLLFSLSIFCHRASAETTINIPILVYHNFNPHTKGSMNLTPQKFESQLRWIKDKGYTVVPLQQVVDYLKGKKDTLPAKAVVVTADDGWQSVYTYMYPIIRQYKIPVTLFIYPETISSGKNAMTWNELHELQNSGYFDIEAHTYSHPNFKQAKKHLSPLRYDALVHKELYDSKQILENKMGKKITLLAWPFGIYNNDLEVAAQKAGYTMAFSIDALAANKKFRSMAQPRFMIVDGLSDKTFEAIIKKSLL